MLTVLHTESSTGWGGQENRTLNEMIGLRALGHTALLACQPGARLGARAREAGFTVCEVRMRNAIDLCAIARLRRFIKDERVAIVNTHSGRDTQLAGMAARSLFAGRPRIVRTRHLAMPITSRFTYAVLPDHVVSVSAFVGDYLASVDVPRAMISAIPTGIDLERYIADPVLPDLKRELGLPADSVLIGTVAILRRKKGHAELLEAVPSILAAHPNAHFVFAGDGPQKANLEARIAALGLNGKVHLLGLRRDVVNVLRSLDLFVLPTHQEALGTALIEAAAMGLPAIASAVDGVPEVLADQETGLLVPAQDSAALAAAINRLLGDADLRARLAANARQRVVERFSRDVMAQNMVALYQHLLAAA